MTQDVITLARWYQTQAELARAQDVAREAEFALAGLIGVVEGVRSAFRLDGIQRIEESLQAARDAMRRLEPVAAGVPISEPVADLPDALRREGGL